MWNLNFITRENLKQHIKNTISTYEKTLDGIDLSKFNSNIVDPIKMVFDSKVYRKNFEEVIKDELVRQRDKTNSNAIGYFHQNMFKYIKKCEVPKEGFDVIYTKNDGTKIYIEMKNKHNTMNSASAGKTYIKMQSQLLDDDDCACFLVEAIAQRSQNIKWETTVDQKRVSHRRIRRVSLDQFYALVTGEQDAFYQMCMILPEVISDVVTNSESKVPHDTVLEELKNIANTVGENDENMVMAIAIYLLGFNSYNGFSNLIHETTETDENMLKRIYAYAKGIMSN